MENKCGKTHLGILLIALAVSLSVSAFSLSLWFVVNNISLEKTVPF